MNFKLVCEPNFTLQHISSTIVHTPYNKEILRSFQHTLHQQNDDAMYLSLMLCYNFQDILEHTLSIVSSKWKRFLRNSLNRLAGQHLNFVLNKDEFLKSCFREYVVS